MCLSLTQRQPIYQLLSMTPLKSTQQPAECPRRTSRHSLNLSTSSPSSLPLSRVPPKPRSCLRRNSSGSNKKRVVFADTKGLALTAVRLFTPELSSLSPAQPKDQLSVSHKLLRHKLQLAFPQPSLDFKAFLARLQEQSIQLESCSISENTLSGKVCVSHASVQKAVYLRVTFDSWRSHQDIPCTFVKHQHCSGLDIDVFSFDFVVPLIMDPSERLEFCVSFRPGLTSMLHWDDNRGQNYRICIQRDELSVSQGHIYHCYPTLPKHRPPAWPQVSSYSSNAADLQYFQRCFSSRFGTVWKISVQ